MAAGDPQHSTRSWCPSSQKTKPPPWNCATPPPWGDQGVPVCPEPHQNPGKERLCLTACSRELGLGDRVGGVQRQQGGGRTPQDCSGLALVGPQTGWGSEGPETSPHPTPCLGQAHLPSARLLRAHLAVCTLGLKFPDLNSELSGSGQGLPQLVQPHPHPFPCPGCHW